MRYATFILLFALPVPLDTYASVQGSASVNDDKENKGNAELKKLAGIWEIESATLGGRPFPNDPKVRIEFKDSIHTTVTLGKAGETVRTVTLDLTADPKRITLTEVELKNGTLVPKADGQVVRAVYALDGDKLTTVQWRGPKPEFPKSLEPKAGEPVMVLVLKKVKN